MRRSALDAGVLLGVGGVSQASMAQARLPEWVERTAISKPVKGCGCRRITRPFDRHGEAMPE